MLLDILLVFLAAAGVALILWCLLGLLLAPVFGRNMVTLCYAEGDGGELEQKIRSYGWLRDGRLTGGRLVIVDCGLTEQGIGRMCLLQERYPWVEYCQRDQLIEYIGAEKSRNPKENVVE